MAAPPTRSDWLLVAALFALVLPLRIWLLCNTEVTARDSIGYIRYALEFERKPWQEVLRGNHQHPGYPVLVLLMSQPVRAIDGQTTPENMELSAQLVNLIAALLLILPMYFLGRQFFDRTVSFGAALLYQYLPISAQHLSDGVSEPIYLVFLVAGLLQMVHAVRDRSACRGALCGMFAGLAYLTRPEGALILPAFGGVLIALQCRAARRCPWRQFFECGAATAMCALLIGAVYFITVGHFSNKPAVDYVTHNTTVAQGHDLFAGQLFAAAVPKVDGTAMLAVRSGWAMCMEINQGFHYVAGIPAILGFLWAFASLRRDAGFWALLLFAVLHGFVLIRLGMVAKYISDRHVMILVLGGTYFAVHALRELPRWLIAWREGGAAVKGGGLAAFAFAVLFLGVIGACLPKATQRLHGNRAENHAAGRWLAERIRDYPDDNAVIFDDHAWSHFFSGLLFQEGREPEFPDDHPSKCYIVTTRSRDPQADLTRCPVTVAKDARIVWPTDGDIENARVVVRVQPRSFKEARWPAPQK